MAANYTSLNLSRSYIGKERYFNMHISYLRFAVLCFLNNLNPPYSR